MNEAMNCRQVCTFLYAYLDNELDSATTLLVENHLGECEDCSCRFTQFEKVREEIRHHVLRLEAPERLKDDIRKICGGRDRGISPLHMLLAASVLILVGALLLPRFIQRPSPSAESPPTAVAAKDKAIGTHVHLEGEIVCLRCSMNQRHVGTAPCSDVGHAFALKTPDGRVWVLLPSRTLDRCLEDGDDAINRRAVLDGLVATVDNPVVDVVTLGLKS